MKTKTTYRVIYGDTDSGGVVYYSNYLRMFEKGRTEHLREHGLPYSELEKRGILAPVIESHCNYHSPAKYDDLLDIETDVTKVGKTSMRFDCIITREGEKIAWGYTVHVFVKKTGKGFIKTEIPEDIRKLFS